MYQTDRGSYKKQETLLQMFWHSCLGKLVVLLAIIGVLLLIAHFTIPSEDKMRTEMIDNIRQCIEANDSIQTDDLDDFVANIGYIFTHADSTVNVEIMSRFNKYNRLKYYKHTFHSSMHVLNNFRPEGIRCGIGVFGLVIPTINFNDLLLRDGPLRKDYGKKLIENMYVPDDYIGDNPNLKPYHYKGNPED